MIKFIQIILFLFPFLVTAQNTSTTILDSKTKKPLNGIQIFSSNGSLICSSDLEGKFNFDKSILKESDIKSIQIYNSEYLPAEYNLDEIPSILYLERIKSYQLEPVVITKSKSQEYYTVKGYFRSWKLINNQLAKYADGLIEYHIPYDIKKRNNFDTGVKNYFIQFRTFISDHTKKENSKFAVHMVDNYLSTYIPIRDLMSYQNTYKLEKLNDTIAEVYAKNKKGEYIKEGYATYDQNQNVKEIKIQVSFDGTESIKVLFWKISGQFYQIEKWEGNDETRHLNYSFSSKKAMVKTKIKEKFDAEETINEIFIDPEIVYDDKKPEVYKKGIDRNKSFYNYEYWKEHLEKHPLPSAVTEQLKNIKENKNIYIE